MTFYELAKSRYSCRSYTDRPVEREKLISCAETAINGPSACNSQPWSFVIVDDRETALALSETMRDGAIRMNAFTRDCPAFIVIVEEGANLSAKLGGKYKDQEYAQIDIGIAAQSICLNATDLGLGTCIIGWFNEKNAAGLLGIPSGKRIRLIIAIGYTETAAPSSKNRKPFEQKVRFNKWK
ncbi:NAD(P)H nitroreductase [Candidatus Nomurabacteria bacterium]|nr:NAD(P)H nitroreductase [Candidatus Nomurabacteria bacterium]